MGKNKALAHHTSTYFHTRRGFLAYPSVPVGDTARAVPTGSHSLLVLFSRNPHNEVRGHRTGSSLSGVEEYPRKKHTHREPNVLPACIIADAIYASARRIQKGEIEGQPMMFQVHAGTHVSLLTPEQKRLQRERSLSAGHPLLLPGP